MKTLTIIALILLVLCGCSNAVGDNVHAGLHEYFNQNWAKNKLWDDGNAEVIKYAAEQNIYGKIREFEYTFILVKEDFNLEFNVKTDDYTRRDLFDVMKVNQFARIETDNYPYHLLGSFFYKRENPLHLHKATISSQEWCGNTFKAFNKNNEGYSYEFNSYWDGQGEGAYQLGEEALFENQLSYSLRSLKFEEGISFSYDVIENQISNKAENPTIYKAKIAVMDQAESNFWKVVVELDKTKVNEYIFEKEYPNILVSQKTWDGRNMKMMSMERKQYWKTNNPN